MTTNLANMNAKLHKEIAHNAVERVNADIVATLDAIEAEVTRIRQLLVTGGQLESLDQCSARDVARGIANDAHTLDCLLYSRNATIIQANLAVWGHKPWRRTRRLSKESR